MIVGGSDGDRFGNRRFGHRTDRSMKLHVNYKCNASRPEYVWVGHCVNLSQLIYNFSVVTQILNVILPNARRSLTATWVKSNAERNLC